MTGGTDTPPLLSMCGIDKSFVGVRVLRGVDLDLRAGEVHALVGENGAGKSTLMKILAGVHSPDAGTLALEGTDTTFDTPRSAQNAGVAIIHQEFNLLPERTVAQNVFLGREPVRRGLVDHDAMERATATLLDGLGEESFPSHARVNELSVAQQQVVEIVKALSLDARIIAMDEPTAALADHEVELLYTLVRRLRDRGIAVLYVSHRLREVFDLSDRITVLKDGAVVRSMPTRQTTTDQLVRLMVGRPLEAYFPPRAGGNVDGAPVVRVENAGNDRVRGIDLTLRAGEIVGLAGLQGAGRTEVAEALFGVHPFTTGQVFLDGNPVRFRTPRAAVRSGLAFVTEDRKSEGLALRQSVRDNAMLVVRASFSGRSTAARTGRIDLKALLASVALVSRGPDQEVRFLSGGNQQKVVLAKWLAVKPRVLLCDEPTRGIDVGAKAAIYEVLRGLAAEGVAILMISSELPELIGMADRIVVLHEGTIAGTLPGGSSEESVMALATGHLVGEVA